MEEVAPLIREAIIAADFSCDLLTILWPRHLPKHRVTEMLTLMWGDDDEESNYPAEDMEVDYEVDDEMDIVEDQVEGFDWKKELFELNFPIEEIEEYG